MTRRLLLYVLGCALLCGCGEGEAERHTQRETSNLRPLAILYGKYLGRHRGQPPASEDEFKKFLAAQTAALEQFEITNVDDLLVSSRDGKPYVVRYRSSPPFPGDLVAYEQAGLDGTRWVADSVGAVTEMTEEEFQAQLKGN